MPPIPLKGCAAKSVRRLAALVVACAACAELQGLHGALPQTPVLPGFLAAGVSHLTLMLACFLSSSAKEFSLGCSV
jgi:hypothetical protein